MKIGETLYIHEREKWRAWLKKNHNKKSEIWLIYYKKGSGKPRIDYNDAVEEALCFGWIDSIVKGIDDNKYTQRFSPRRKGSSWSETNKERIRKLIKNGKMTKMGLARFDEDLDEEFKVPKDILNKLQEDVDVWKNFQSFSKRYKRVRIGWIDSARPRSKEFKKRLNYFLKMTKKGKQYGQIK